MADESQWQFLLAALDRIEVRMQRQAETDSAQAATLISIKENIQRVEEDIDIKLGDMWTRIDKRIQPIETITEKIHAIKITLLSIFAALVTISAAIGAWSVIDKWLNHM